MTIAITGATGHLGQLAVAALKARDPKADLVALVRDPAKATALAVPARAFDYHKTETLVPALKGVDVLVLISSNDFDDRAGQHANVIAAAKEAGVGRVIYTSILRADTTPMQILPADHIKTEATLKASGLTYTILRNGWYTENYTGNLGPALEHGAIIGAAKDGRVSSASRADYAEAIAVTALGAGHEGKVYELAGDDSYSLTELAAEVARQSGKPVAYVNMAQGEYAKALEGFGLPAGFAAVLADSDFSVSEGALFDDSRTLSKLIGRPTTPLAKTVAEALA